MRKFFGNCKGLGTPRHAFCRALGTPGLLESIFKSCLQLDEDVLHLNMGGTETESIIFAGLLKLCLKLELVM